MPSSATRRKIQRRKILQACSDGIQKVDTSSRAAVCYANKGSKIAASDSDND
jgi:hypothetical protein